MTIIVEFSTILELADLLKQPVFQTTHATSVDRRCRILTQIPFVDLDLGGIY